MPAWLLPAIGMAANAAGTLFQNFFGKHSADEQNRKSREWSEMMYNRQRSDANADWLTMNEYNSPKAMMGRLKEAGLNPNLAYGQVSGGQAVMPRASSSEKPQFESYKPQLGGFGDSINSYQDVQIRQAQLDNLTAQNSVIKQEALLKWIETESKSRDVDKKNIDLSGSGELDKDGNLEKNLYQKLKETQLSVLQNILKQGETKVQQGEQSIKESLERVITMKQGRSLSQSQIKSIEKDSELKQLDIELRKKGITSSDPMWARILARFMEKFGLNP